MIENDYKQIDVDNEVVVCKDLWVLPICVYALASLLALILLFNELRLLKYRKNLNRFEAFQGENTTFFSRLSNLEKKRWLAEETYIR